MKKILFIFNYSLKLEESQSKYLTRFKYFQDYINSNEKVKDKDKYIIKSRIFLSNAISNIKQAERV